MKIRAAIFDVYGTLLRVGPPPPEAEARWEKLFQDLFQASPRLSRLEFSVACNQVIARRHAVARERGIAHPEILWPSIVAEAFPEFARLKTGQQEEFVFRQIQTGRTINLQAGAEGALKFLRQRGCTLGIASNAQAYTLRELGEALAGAELDFGIFERDLTFWSFENGFSKPDPHVFRILTARLEARGIRPAETMVVGDRLDNDVSPAAAQGFLTWHLNASTVATGWTGDWNQFVARIEHAG